MLESKFQAYLVKKIEDRYVGSIVMKMDANQTQGWPDLLILFNTRWATLEVKASEKAKHRPNQDYYVAKFNTLTYSSFIYPENEEQVFEDLDRFFFAVIN